MYWIGDALRGHGFDQSGEIADGDLLLAADVEDLDPPRSGCSISLASAPTVSLTWQKQRDCVPSPKTVSGWPASAARTKLGSTMP